MIYKKFIMVNTVFLLLSLFVSSDLISQETTQKNDFRNSMWGMKKDKVLSSEKNKPIKAFTQGQYFVIEYTGEIANIKAHYVYYFLDDVLVKGGYVFNAKYSNKNEYIYDYNKLKEILTRKYGSTKKSDYYWDNDLYKNSPQDYGRAVSIGHLSLINDWETDRTFIFLVLMGNNFNLTMALTYRSKIHKELIDKAEKTAQEQGL